METTISVPRSHFFMSWRVQVDKTIASIFWQSASYPAMFCYCCGFITKSHSLMAGL